MSIPNVPAGKFEEEESVPVWTETSTSRFEVCHRMWDQTVQGKLSEINDIILSIFLKVETI